MTIHLRMAAAAIGFTALVGAPACKSARHSSNANSTPAVAVGAASPTGSSNTARGAQTVDGKTARTLVAEGAYLLDVRTSAEFSEGHIEGAHNIPVQELASRLAELPGKDRAIVVYCRSGRRSKDASTQLAQAGYAALYDLGPMSAW